MQTQRDHVHAHQFQMGRMSSALVLGDPTSAENPSNRSMVGLLVGLVLAVLIVAGFAVYGLLVPGGSKAWSAEGAIIVEKETGNRYVYLNGSLRPTLNLTSAMLIEGPSSKIQLTSRNSLKGVPHGSPIGIAGAPQSVPAPGSIVTGGWLACLSGSVGGPADGVSLNLDPAAVSRQLGADRFMLVNAGGDDYLVWRNHRFKITDPAVAVALGVTNATPIPAPMTWLEILTPDQELSVPKIPGRGQDGPPVAGTTYQVGQVFSQGGDNGDQLFVLRQDGLAAVDRTAYLLLQSASKTPVQLDPAQVASAPRSGDKSLTGMLPALGSAKFEDPAGQVLCQYQEPKTAKSVNFAVVLTDRANAALREDGTPRVNVRPGTGMVVYPVPMPATLSTPEPYLISDEGISYSMPENETLTALKIPTSAMVPFPRGLLKTIKSGPVLSLKAIDVTEGGTTS
jgi:type VII secretion protein EccB